MKLLIVFLTFAFFASSLKADVCTAILAQASLASSPSSSTDSYLKLLKILVEEKNAFDAADLDALLLHPDPANPFSIVEGQLSSADRFSFSRAFDILLKQASFDDNSVPAYLQQALAKKREGEGARASAESETARIYFSDVKAVVRYQSPAWEEIHLSHRLPDGRLLVFTTTGVDGLRLYVLDSHMKLVKSERFGQSKEALVLTTTSGESVITTLSGSGELRLYSINQVNEFTFLAPVISVTKEEAQLVSLNENVNGAPIIVLAEKRQTTDAKGNKSAPKITRYIEINLKSGEQREFRGDWYHSSRTHTFVSGNGHVMNVEVKTEKKEVLALRDLTLDTLPREIVIPELFPLDLSLILAPDASHVYLPYLSKKEAMWLDFQTGAFTNLTPHIQAMSHPLLLIPHKEGYIFPPRPYTQHIVFGDETKIKSFQSPRLSTADDRVQYLKRRDGRSLLLIGPDKNWQGILPEPFVIIDLDRGAIRTIDLKNPVNLIFHNALETEQGEIYGVFVGGEGFKIIQLYGPLGENRAAP